MVTASNIAKSFLDNVGKINSLPNEIVSDRDMKLTDEYWKSLYKQLNI